MLGLAEALRPQHKTCFLSFSESGLCRAFLNEVRCAGFEGMAVHRDTPHLLGALKELFAQLSRIDVKVLLCHGYKANLLGLLAARRLHIPTIAVSRGWTGECRKVRLFEALDRIVLRWMDHVVCVSHAQVLRVRAARVREDRITVIHNAVHPGRFASPRPEYRDRLRGLFSDPPDRIVGAAGRLSPEKGFDVLIAAAERIQHSPCVASANRRPASVGFVLFGEGPLRETLVRQIAACGLQGHFILAGFRDDLDSYLPHLDLFVQSSHTEGMPNVILEALAAGVPVVATAVGGTPEVIEDGQTGLLVHAGDPPALAERIALLVADATLRSKMRIHGHRRVERYFSFEAQARAYKDLFTSLNSTAGISGKFADIRRSASVAKPAGTVRK